MKNQDSDTSANPVDNLVAVLVLLFILYITYKILSLVLVTIRDVYSIIDGCFRRSLLFLYELLANTLVFCILMFAFGIVITAICAVAKEQGLSIPFLEKALGGSVAFGYIKNNTLTQWISSNTYGFSFTHFSESIIDTIASRLEHIVAMFH